MKIRPKTVVYSIRMKISLKLKVYSNNNNNNNNNIRMKLGQNHSLQYWDENWAEIMVYSIMMKV